MNQFFSPVRKITEANMRRTGMKRTGSVCLVEMKGCSSIYQHCKRSLVWQLRSLHRFPPFTLRHTATVKTKTSLFRVYIWMLNEWLWNSKQLKWRLLFLRNYFLVQKHVKRRDVFIDLAVNDALQVGEKYSLGSRLWVRAGQQLHEGWKCGVSESCLEVFLSLGDFKVQGRLFTADPWSALKVGNQVGSVWECTVWQNIIDSLYMSIEISLLLCSAW